MGGSSSVSITSALFILCFFAPLYFFNYQKKRNQVNQPADKGVELFVEVHLNLQSRVVKIPLHSWFSVQLWWIAVKPHKLMHEWGLYIIIRWEVRMKYGVMVEMDCRWSITINKSKLYYYKCSVLWSQSDDTPHDFDPWQESYQSLCTEQVKLGTYTLLTPLPLPGWL